MGGIDLLNSICYNSCINTIPRQYLNKFVKSKKDTSNVISEY